MRGESGRAVSVALRQARARGACLRVDLSLPEGDPGLTPKEAALAVSLEPEGGSPGPTTTPFLVAQTSGQS